MIIILIIIILLTIVDRGCAGILGGPLEVQRYARHVYGVKVCVCVSRYVKACVDVKGLVGLIIVLGQYVLG